MGLTLQQRLVNEKSCRLKRPYSYGPYNKIKGDKQAIRLTEGCVWQCFNCYEPKELKVFEFPKIERNNVLIFDMNLLCKPEALDIIQKLGKVTVNGKPVVYELVCGVDYRFLTQDLADAMFNARFGYVGFDNKCHVGNRTIRVAWDGRFSEQRKINKAKKILFTAGYKSKDIMVFILCNYSLVSYEECCLKLDLCKVWNVRVCDCYYNGQVGANIKPEFWTKEQIISFRAKVRKHNQLVNFGIDPECKEAIV